MVEGLFSILSVPAIKYGINWEYTSVLRTFFSPKKISFLSCVYLALQYYFPIKGRELIRQRVSPKETVGKTHFKFYVHCCNDTAAGRF